MGTVTWVPCCVKKDTGPAEIAAIVAINPLFPSSYEEGKSGFMATIAAISAGPVSFFTQQGTQVTVPISSLEFSDGNLQLRSSYRGPNPAGLSAWLNYLATAGVIVPGAAP